VVIANSRLTSNAWPPRPAPTPIAGSTLALLLHRRAEVIGGATEMTLGSGCHSLIHFGALRLEGRDLGIALRATEDAA
jgi:hypothetical protein